MSASAARRRVGRMSTAEFLAWPGDGAGGRYQLVDGELAAMAPAADAHALIQTELAFLLTRHLRKSRPGCHARTEPGVAPRTSRDGNVRVPDLAVSCVPNEAGQQLLRDPLLIVEILSPTNERETRLNVWAYTTIPSVREILIVRSVEIGAELLRRGPDGTWPDEPMLLGASDDLPLDSIGAVFPLDDCYVATSLGRPAR